MESCSVRHKFWGPKSPLSRQTESGQFQSTSNVIRKWEYRFYVYVPQKSLADKESNAPFSLKLLAAAIMYVLKHDKNNEILFWMKRSHSLYQW